MPAPRLTTLVVALPLIVGDLDEHPPAGAQPPLGGRAIPPAPDGPMRSSAGAVGRLGGGQFRCVSDGLMRGPVSLSADGRTLAYTVMSPAGDDRVIIRRIPGGDDVRQFDVKLDGRPLIITLTPDGGHLVRTFWHGEVSVTDLASGTRDRIGFPAAQPGPGEWRQLSFSADGRRVAGGGVFTASGGRAAVWDRADKKLLLNAAPVHPTHHTTVLSADGKTAASYGAFIRPPNPPERTHIVQVWDVDAGAERFQITADHPVDAAALSPDGSWLAAATQHGFVLYDATRRGPGRVLDGAAGSYASPAFSPDGKRVAAVAPDGAVRVWDAAGGERLSETPARSGLRPSIRFTAPDRGIALALPERITSSPHVIEVWEFPSGTLLTPRGAHAHPVTSVAFAADGKAVFSGDRNGVLAAWNPAKPADATITAFRRPGPPAIPGDYRPTTGPLTIAPGGGHVAMCIGLDWESDYVFDLTTKQPVFVASRERRDGIPSVFSPDGTKVFFPYGGNFNRGGFKPAGVCEVAVGGKKLVDVATGKETQAAAFSPDGRRLVTVAPTKRNDSLGPLTVVVWDAASGSNRGEVIVPDRGYRPFAAVSNTGGVVLSTHTRVVALDVPGGREGEVIDRSPQWGDTGPGAVTFSPDGKLLAAGMPTDKPGVYGVRVYDWPHGRRLHEFSGHTGRVTALAFSADGTLLASGSDDTSVVVWDMAAVVKR